MKKNKHIQLKPEEYEGYQYGPLKIERIGRVVRLSNTSSPEEHQKLINHVTTQHPILKKNIDAKIQRLLEISKKYNCLELLATISFHNSLGDPEEYKETTYEGRESYVEYALSLATCVSNLQNKLPDGTVSEEFEKLIKDVFQEVMWFFLTEDIVSKSDAKNTDIKSMSLLRYLMIRGSSFAEHHIDLISDVFNDPQIIGFFQTAYGFTPIDMINTYNNIEKQISSNFESYRSFAQKTKQLQEKFIDYCDTDEAKKLGNEKELKEKFHSLPGVKEQIDEAQKIISQTSLNPFKVSPQNDKEKLIFSLISIKQSENTEFIEPPHADAWPTNSSSIYRNPILSADKNYYCFAPQILFRQMQEILEELIKKNNLSFYSTHYVERRAKFLESKTIEYLSKLLPEARIYQNLYYYPNNDGLNPTEVDAIILYEDNIFLIECKSGKYTTPAQRGAIETVKRDAKKLVDEAYNQAKAVKKYIDNTDQPKFYDKNKSLILKLLNKGQYENYFFINTTLDPLNHLTTQINSLRNLGLIQGNEWPWSVFINDLRVVSEILETPTEFLLFLQRRIRANDFPQFTSFDELDFLMFFLNEGLFFEDGVLGDLDRLNLSGYTEELDRYYDHLAGRVSSGNKPRMKILDDYRNLINKIEALKKPYKTKLSTHLLSLSTEAQRGILDNLRTLFRQHLEAHDTHDASLFFKNYGITFAIPDRNDVEFREKMETFCQVKKYSAKFGEWFLVILTGNSLENYSIDFEVYKYPWQPDETTKNDFEAYKRAKWLRMKQRHEKIGRNDTCFCGSGKKYKKCCLLAGFS